MDPVREKLIEFAQKMQSIDRWDMYEAAIEVMRQPTVTMQDYADLYRTYAKTQQELVPAPAAAQQQKQPKFFLQEYNKCMRNL